MMAMSKERLTEIKASPIIDWAEVTELIAEVERLTAVVFPAPEQLTDMEGLARDTLEKTQSSIVMTALAEHFLTVGSALREHDARLIAADERLAACEAAHEQAMVVADHLAEVARRLTDQRDAARGACEEWNQVAGRLHAELDVEKERAASWQADAEAAHRSRDEVKAERDEARRLRDKYCDALEVANDNTKRRDVSLKLVEADRDRLAAAVQRVRELCARGPGPSNEYQIWTVDVLAALDSDGQKASGT